MALFCRLLCFGSLLAASWPAAAYQFPYVSLPGSLALLFLSILCLILGWKLRSSMQKSQQLDNFMQHHQDAVCLLNAELHMLQVNPAFTAITGLTDAQAIGQPLKLFNSKGEPENIARAIQKALLKHQHWRGEIWSRKANQQVFALDLAISCIRVATKSQAALYMATFCDISARKMSELELRRVNTKDPGTRLPNRAVFLDYLEREIQTVSEQHPRFAVMILRIEALSSHELQHQIPLAELAATIRAEVPHGAILARLSSNEFAVLLPAHLVSQRIDLQSYRLAQRLLSALAASSQMALNPCLGIALYPEDGHSYDQLLRSADHALQRSQVTDAQPVQFFHQAALPRTSESFALEQELQQALQQHQLRLSYQPKLCVSSNRVTGLEALVRWQHPKRGLLLPQQFIPIASESQCMVQLDQMVLQQACQQLAQWQSTGLMRGRLALNIANQTFFQPSFLAQYLQRIQQHNLSPEQFELELDQSILTEQPELSKQILANAKAAGFFLVLDRFGSGLSALQHLRDYPFDQIKIDGRLIQKLEQSEQDRNITASLIRMAGYLQLSVVACQVENEMQAYLLHVMGCETIQGHVFSKAVLPSELAAVLTRESRAIQQKSG
ncbi:EAL domain-containing protein [Alkalimonas sp. NCh-2]|uniref:EAL domain-containing protein n=1 Tax=Alkalimonas sp. NCh-2 TaxID=3144846 RepID=UPI0031F71905